MHPSLMPISEVYKRTHDSSEYESDEPNAPAKLTAKYERAFGLLRSATEAEQAGRLVQAKEHYRAGINVFMKLKEVEADRDKRAVIVQSLATFVSSAERVDRLLNLRAGMPTTPRTDEFRSEVGSLISDKQRRGEVSASARSSTSSSGRKRYRGRKPSPLNGAQSEALRSINRGSQYEEDSAGENPNPSSTSPTPNLDNIDKMKKKKKKKKKKRRKHRKRREGTDEETQYEDGYTSFEELEAEIEAEERRGYKEEREEMKRSERDAVSVSEYSDEYTQYTNTAPYSQQSTMYSEVSAGSGGSIESVKAWYRRHQLCICLLFLLALIPAIVFMVFWLKKENQPNPAGLNQSAQAYSFQVQALYSNNNPTGAGLSQYQVWKQLDSTDEIVHQELNLGSDEMVHIHTYEPTDSNGDGTTSWHETMVTFIVTSPSHSVNKNHEGRLDTDNPDNAEFIQNLENELTEEVVRASENTLAMMTITGTTPVNLGSWPGPNVNPPPPTKRPTARPTDAAPTPPPTNAPPYPRLPPKSERTYITMTVWWWTLVGFLALFLVIPTAFALLAKCFCSREPLETNLNERLLAD